MLHLAVQANLRQQVKEQSSGRSHKVKEFFED